MGETTGRTARQKVHSPAKRPQSVAEAAAQPVPTTRREPDVDGETPALAAECRSFAELLARASRGRSSE